MSEIRLENSGKWEIYLLCPNEAIPSAGQYTLATDPADQLAVLGIPLFASEVTTRGFWSCPVYPTSWAPGTILELVGPSGHGFVFPRNVLRLGLVAMGETIARLKPIILSKPQTSTSITLFTDLPLPRLPTTVEISPLIMLKESIDWPDFLAIDVPMRQISDIRAMLGIADGASLPCPTQVLISTPMPCAGLAGCGACGVKARNGWKLTCEDGPVFDLNSIQW